jgi:hypothetical protein
VLLEIQVTVRATPASASTFATNACVALGARIALEGETVTPRTAGATTVMVTLTRFDVFAVDVAVMLAVPAPTAVTKPSVLTEATLELLVPQVTAWFADSWIVAPTDTGPVGAPEIVKSGAMDTSSPHAASPASTPAASNDRKSFCILVPLLECEYLHVRLSTFAAPDSGDAPRPGTTTCIRSNAHKGRSAAFVFNDRRPHHAIRRHFLLYVLTCCLLTTCNSARDNRGARSCGQADNGYSWPYHYNT